MADCISIEEKNFLVESIERTRGLAFADCDRLHLLFQLATALRDAGFELRLVFRGV